jgi:dTDP-4-dehydrorhamnose 3,5-epimerase
MDVKLDTTIDGVSVRPLKVIGDERGAVMHMLRADSPEFTTFGEVYFSVIKPGVIKAWKRHQQMTQRITVPFGKIKLVIVDTRSDSHTHGMTQEVLLGRPDHYQLVKIPPLLCYGFQNISTEEAIIANCPDRAYEANESEQLDLSAKELSYVW